MKFLGEESHVQHPRVMGAGNIINLECRGSADYFGPLYVGSYYREQKMTFDTASHGLTVNNIDSNAQLVGNYDASESESAAALYDDVAKQTQKEVSIDFGRFYLRGTRYTDNMCLQQIRSERTDFTGRMCVRSMPFTSIKTINGPFNANGIVGLAPSEDRSSYVDQLYQ